MGYRLKNIISVLEQDETGARRLAMIIPNEYKKYKNTENQRREPYMDILGYMREYRVGFFDGLLLI